MPRFRNLILLAYLTPPALAQAPATDEAMLAKARNAYDAPFTRGLILFDCAVQFDWKQHFVAALGSVPPAAAPVIERLQTIPHRVLVDRSGTTVSAIPKEPDDLTAIPHAADLEQMIKTMTKAGLDEWLPFATNVILPMSPTKYQFEKLDEGYKLTMNGPGVAATLMLNPELRITSVVAQQPQPLRFTTSFSDGPQGYLLSTTTTAPTTDATVGKATFGYTYQVVQGAQLPAAITISPANGETWQYALTNCQVSKSITLKVSAPPAIEPTDPH